MVGSGAEAVHVVPVLLGRARCAASRFSVHLFGAVSPGDTGALGYRVFGGRRGLTKNDCRTRTGAVRIALAGRETQRFGTVTPLTDVAFLSGAPWPETPPVGVVASMNARSTVKAAVSFDDGTFMRTLFFDIGQTIELYADCVWVEWIAPVQFVDVSDFGTQPVPAQTGLVLDSYVSASIWEIEAPVGEFRGHFTRDVVVLQGTQVTIPVPDGTKAVQIFQSTLGNAAVNWTGWIGDPAVVAGSIMKSTLSFEPALRRTPILAIGDETHIRSDLDNATDRFFHVVFQIEP